MALWQGLRQAHIEMISIGHIYYHRTIVVKSHWKHLQSCGKGVIDRGYTYNDGTSTVKHQHWDGDSHCPNSSDGWKCSRDCNLTNTTLCLRSCIYILCADVGSLI